MLELINMGPATINEDYPLNEDALKLCLDVSDTYFLGKCRAFWYKDHNPKITIGPHCIF